MSSPRKLFLGGEWRATADTTLVRNPFDGAAVAELHQATAAEIEEAVAIADRAFDRARKLQSFEREAMLLAIASGIEARREEFARCIMAEGGKPITFARGEVSRAANTFRIAAEECKRLHGEVMSLDWTKDSPSRTGLTRRFPVGPVTAISPFNFPLNLVAHKVAPALAAGNPVISKPAHQTPLTALLLAEVVEQAGVPKGMFQVLPCLGPVAQALVTHPKIKIVSFTGSPPVGWKLKELANKKKVTLELGGNAAAIIEPDADLGFAADRIALGAFAYAGQVCISVQRVFVHGQVYDAFRTRLMGAVESKIRMGDPAEESTVVGPVIEDSAADRIHGWIERARNGGARLLSGGERRGRMIAPTVIEDARPEMEVCSKEVFGPVVVLQRYGEFGEAVAAANDSSYGLQAGVFTRDLPKLWRAFQELEVGGVIANDYPMYRADQMPYGGVKESGFGREGLRYAIEEMTEQRLLVLNFSPFPEV
ncbi:MAG: aldehyde dehydrogenase family protein [Candidatus Wallbacteria bacterium]|nr:aldehyde dehydrogenase family protein [Candidatus Wallbacteria bacterium]